MDSYASSPKPLVANGRPSEYDFMDRKTKVNLLNQKLTLPTVACDDDNPDVAGEEELLSKPINPVHDMATAYVSQRNKKKPHFENQKGEDLWEQPIRAGDKRLYKIRPTAQRFPLCIVWTPLPFWTALIPFIGHAGIGDVDGVIHDFDRVLTVDDFAYDGVYKYVVLNLRGIT